MVVLASVIVCTCATTAPLTSADTAAVDRLLGLVVQRLAVAPDVARTKWNTKAPIEDPIRERQIITAVGERAADYGVPRAFAERFFDAQIEASKVIQRAMHAEFTAAGRPPFPTVVDLNADIRPILDRLTPELLRALGDALPVLARPGGRARLESRSRRPGPDAPGAGDAMRTAIAPLLASSP